MEEQAGPINHALRNQRHHHGGRLPTAAAVNCQQLFGGSQPRERALRKPPDVALATALLASTASALLEEAVARSNGQPSAARSRRLPSGRWPSLLLWRRPIRLENPASNLLADLGGDLIWQAPEQGQAGAAAAGTLLEPHHPACAGP